MLREIKTNQSLKKKINKNSPIAPLKPENQMMNLNVEVILFCVR